MLFTANNLLGTSECPEINVCFNAENLWETKIPREISGLDKRVSFENLPNVRTALRVLKRGTYWYHQLLHKKKKFKSSVFQRRMARLLAGFSSPEGTEPYHVVKDMKVNSAAVQRFRSILATVDGLLMQTVLAFPGDARVQNWTRIDQIQRSMIANLLVDYFRQDNPNRVSTFEKVKTIRKEVKMHGFNPASSLDRVKVPRELSALQVLINLVDRGNTPMHYLQVMLLSQTRASGVPPKSVYTKTLNKTKAILNTPSDRSLYEEIKGPLTRAVDHLYSDLLTRLGSTEQRDRFFESVMRESKISLSDSGEFFTTADAGGKLEAARRILRMHPVIPEINLHTGANTGRLLDHNSPIGERLFHWACGKFQDRKSCYKANNMCCRISLVAELGKYRTITVSSLQHALLLHPFSHMGLKILEALPSSQSGVGAANHSWNFFKRLSHKNPSASFIFDEKIQTAVYSTDWETATDYCDPYIAGAMLNRLSEALGVPKWYRETMLFALTAPRQVETIDRNGVPELSFVTKRGVLMGDPVTKVVLHLYHLVGRRMAGNLMYEVFIDRVLDHDDSSDEEDTPKE